MEILLLLIGLAVGALTFAPGLDLHLTWRAEESHWQLGLRAVRYSDEFQFYGVSLTETTTTMAGPTLNYLFTPHSHASSTTWTASVPSSTSSTRIP